MGLLSYQKDNLSMLEACISDNKIINIIAPRGSGVKTVINSLDFSKYSVLVINPNKKSPYSDIIFAIIQNQNILRHGFTLKISPSINLNASAKPMGVDIGLGIGIGLEIQKDNQFTRFENSIKKELKKILKNKNLVFVLTDEANTDTMSKKLIFDLLDAPSKKNKKFRTILISLNSDVSNGKKLFFKFIQDYQATEKAINELNLNPSICLSSNVISFIYKNIAADIGILKELVDSLNSKKLDIDLNKYDTDNVLKKLITRAISSYKYGNAINEIMSILAISGEGFNAQEFSFMLNKDSQSIKILLDFASEKIFIGNQNGTYKILFNLLIQMFSSIDDLEKHEIYLKIFNLIDTYYPDNYEAKYKFAQYAKEERGEIFLLQKLFADIRLGNSVNLDLYIDKLSAQNFELLKKYLNVIVDLRNNNYERSIALIESIISTCSSPIKQEFALLLSQNLIKLLDLKARSRAIVVLSYDKSDSNIDDYLQYRMDTRKIAAQIHNGNYKEAYSESNILENELITKINKTNSPGLQRCLNIIYRKYSFIHNYDSSVQQIQMSVEYFNSCNDLRAKYIALNNLMAINLINGQTALAENNRADIDKLVYNSCDIQFHRKEIYSNNVLILKYLQGNLSPDALSIDFEKLYSSTVKLADNIFIASNYAIMLTLNNKIDDAIKLLREKKNNVKEDQEGIYAYRINGNLAILLYLQDCKSDEPMKLLNAIKLNSDDIHTSARNKQIERLKTLISRKEQYTIESWQNEHAKLVDSSLNYLKLYEQPFIFTSLFDWDDE